MADPKSYTEHLSAVALQLEQSTTAAAQYATAANLAPVLVRGLSLVSDYSPYIVLVRRRIESRYGIATTDTASALVDATNAQFLSTDTDKVIYNASTCRWGVVTAYVSTSQITLDHDLFPDGNEAYYMFNAGCMNSKQVNISDFPGYTKVKSAEYPVGTPRYIDSDVNGIVEIGYDGGMPNSSSVADTSPDIIVHLYLKRRHFISQLTTFTGAVDLPAGYVAGSTSMVIDGLTTADVVKRGQPFTIAGVPGEYTVTDDVTVADSHATVSFFPGLEVAATDDDAVTWVKSTLTPELEEIFDDWCSGKMMRNKSAVLGVKQFINAANTVKASMDWANEVISDAEARLQQIALRNLVPIKVLARM